jgi:hypothetical protein
MIVEYVSLGRPISDDQYDWRICGERKEVAANGEEMLSLAGYHSDQANAES